MDIKHGKENLTLSDIKQYSMWKCDRNDDLMYPVMNIEDFPDNSFDLEIRAKFITSSGLELMGTIVGVRNIYCVIIYIGDKFFPFNKNLLQYYPKTLEKLSEALGRQLTISDFSPLKYTTDIDLKGFRNIQGEFDLLKEKTMQDQIEEQIERAKEEGVDLLTIIMPYEGESFLDPQTEEIFTLSKLKEEETLKELMNIAKRNNVNKLSIHRLDGSECFIDPKTGEIINKNSVD